MASPIRRYSAVRPSTARRRAHGFTYIGLLILIAIIGIASAATIQLGSVLQRRAAEEELLAIGQEFRNALLSYANATPPGQSRSPTSLHDLLKDPRYPNPLRHLRRLYTDPITGKDEWGTVAALDVSRGIAGVYSLSEQKPIKMGNFPTFVGFENKGSYREWQFVFSEAAIRPLSTSALAPAHTP